MTSKQPSIKELNDVSRVYSQEIERIMREKRNTLNIEMPDPSESDLMSPFIEKLKEALPNSVFVFDGYYYRKCDREYCVKMKCWIKPSDVNNTTAELKQIKLEEIDAWKTKKDAALKAWYIKAVEARILPDAEIEKFHFE